MFIYLLFLKFEDVLKNIVFFVVFLEDKDFVFVCGFVWIYWLVVNIIKDELNENESVIVIDFV